SRSVSARRRPPSTTPRWRSTPRRTSSPATRRRAERVASGRSRVAMSDDEVTAFLQGQLKVQVASLGPDGAPHLTTLFYVLHEGRIAFWTYTSSQKVKNLDRDPRISCLVEAGNDYFELEGVSIQGTAEVIRDHDRIREIG